MPSNTYEPLKTSQARVFIIEWRARIDRTPDYRSCYKMGGLSKTYGDVTTIEMPSESSYDGFYEAGEIRGTAERATASLIGRYARKLRSDLIKLGEIGCSFDVQLHLGACQAPDDFDTFDKALVFEDVLIPDISTDDLGALESGERAVVNETASISAKSFFEILPLSFGPKAASIVTNEVIDVAICDTKSCGECESPSDGCQRIYAITKAAGGSPSTPADVVFSIDGGSNWYAHDIDTLGAAEEPSALDCLKGYLIVVSNETDSLHYVDLDDLNEYTDPAFTEVTTGFVAAGSPNDIYSVGSLAFVVGDAGYVYKLENASSGVSVLDAGSATTNDLLRVHAIDQETAIAVGENGAIVYTTNGTEWSASPASPVGFGVHLMAGVIVTDTVWVVGANNGNIYYTTNGGNTWTTGSFTGSGAGVVYDIMPATDSIWYMAHATATPLGRILRSYNAGATWVVCPEGSGTLTANDRVNRLAPCEFDANMVVGVGLADDGSDGFITVGQLTD